MWFRQVLRVNDHPALLAAANTGSPLVLLYILDDESPGDWGLGGARRWWLHESLAALDRELQALGGRLILAKGRFSTILSEVAKAADAAAIYCTRSYEPWARTLEDGLEKQLRQESVDFKRFACALLFEPEALRTKANEPFRVFTPFWRALSAASPRRPSPAPTEITSLTELPRGERLEAWKLQPAKPDWAGGLRGSWTPGAKAAVKQLDTFIAETLTRYHKSRDRPDVKGTSRLSPYLANGEISPSTCWHAAIAAAGSASAGLETFLRELAWREFSYHLLFHWPDLLQAPFRPEFAAFPWKADASALDAWQRGRTGYPMVDAGMRELWHTGWMHNRARMIAASFLVKHLLIPWQHGERWFWDCLVDADLANNSASWQWVAGSGADAAPYFRIFNPVKQGETFDPHGDYVRRWVPELGDLPPEHIHAPWLASSSILKKAGVELGKTYPDPIVDHAEARARALAAFAEIKSGVHS